MATVKTVWGIDVGECALKALKLRLVDGELRADAFDIIEHPKILSQPEVDRDQLMRNALEQFLARNNVAGSVVVISAAGQSGFTRFVKLPPVEISQVPEIVRFEAEQQIPFEMSEVIWRWQAFVDPDSPDIEVGIFAMKRTDVGDVLARFEESGISVDMVQMAPLALYNFAFYDGQNADDGATLVVDVGAEKTDLIVSDGPRIWTRALQLGGNNFTAALVKAFKLSFNKAEKLKRTAATSKYARQIFQAMRPVFAELVQEIQRSIGYYTSLHRDSRFNRVIGLGNGFRLPGLQKFLEQNLGISVVRADGYNKLPPSAVVNAPAFSDNVLSFAVAYGLAIQGLGLAKIHTNLLPTSIARKRLWAKKRGWFAAAAAVFLVALGALVLSVVAETRQLDPAGNKILDRVGSTVQFQKELQSEHRKCKGLDRAEEKKIEHYRNMLGFRNVWPELHFMISEAIRAVATDQHMLNEENIDELVARVKDRSQRKVVVIESIRAVYLEDMGDIERDDLRKIQPQQGQTSDYARLRPEARRAPPDEFYDRRPSGDGRLKTKQPKSDAKAKERGYVICIECTTPQTQHASTFMSAIVAQMRDVAKKYPSFEYKAGRTDPVAAIAGRAVARMVSDPTRMRAGVGLSGQEVAVVDPLTGEDASQDKRFQIRWALAITEPEAPVPDALVAGKEVRR